MGNTDFSTMVKNDFENFFVDTELGESVEHIKVTETYSSDNSSDPGFLINKTEESTIITAIIRNINLEDKLFEEFGTMKEGDVHGRFKIEDNVLEGDLIKTVSTNRNYEVSERIHDGGIGGVRTFDHFILKLRTPT